MTHRAQILLALHSWPGNVRELENVLGHASHDDHGRYDRRPGSAGLHAVPIGSDGAVGARITEQAGTLDEQERVLIVRALEAAGGNQSQAARALRIGRDALRYKLKKHNLETTRSERGTATAG